MIQGVIDFVDRCYTDLGFEIGIHTDPTIRGIRYLKDVSSGGAICDSDVELMVSLSELFTPKAIYCVGNAFGYSTITLAHIFPKTPIDVIDAEIEGKDNKLGTRITRTIADKYGYDVNLFAGFSPEDTHKCLRFNTYDLVFIDGYHSNEQLVRDFVGIYAKLSPKCVLILHDVKLSKLYRGVNDIRVLDTNFRCMTYKSRDYNNTIGTALLYRDFDLDAITECDELSIQECDGFNLSRIKVYPRMTYRSHGATLTYDGGTYTFKRDPFAGSHPYQWLGMDILEHHKGIINFDIRFTQPVEYHKEIGLRFTKNPAVYNSWLYDDTEWHHVSYVMEDKHETFDFMFLMFDDAISPIEFELKNLTIE